MTPLAQSRIPVCDTSNPAELETWFGAFGYADHVRKIVLSNCAEIVRARAVAEEAKLSESRVDHLAHIHDFYLDFIIQCLAGRQLREQNVRESIDRGQPFGGR